MGSLNSINLYRLRYFLILIVTTFLVKPVFAEKMSESFERTSGTGLSLQTTLSKDEYRSEAYEDTYTEEVAYEETEWYTDYEEYYEREQECKQVSVPKEVCRNERYCEKVPTSETVCHNENQCRRVPHRSCTRREECVETRGGRRCRPVNDCTTEYEEECSTERVCEERTSYETQCDTRPVCETRNEYETRCHWVNKRKTRPIQKQRTVTKYRTEERCCVTRYRDVYDHTWELPVEVSFPAQTQLYDNETEQGYIELSGSESSPGAQISFLDSIFKYEIERESFVNGIYFIELSQKPHLGESEIGANTIESLKLKINKNQRAKVEFLDHSQRERIKSIYLIQIYKLNTSELVYESEIQNQNSDHIEHILDTPLSPSEDYLIKLNVEREGVVVVNGLVQFQVENQYRFKRLDPNQFGKNSFKKPTFIEKQNQLYMHIQDLGLDEAVESKYQIKVWNSKTKELLFENSYSPNSLILESQREILLKDLEYKTNSLLWEVHVLRTSPFLENDISFKYSDTYFYHIDLDPYKDKEMIQIKGLTGEGLSGLLSFTDQTKVISAIETEYEITIQRKGFFSGLKTLANKKIARKDFNNQSSFQLSLINDLNGDERLVKKYLKSGNKIYISIKVIRKDVRNGTKVISNFEQSTKSRL